MAKKKNILFDRRTILFVVFGVLLIFALSNSGNIRTFIGVIFDVADEELIPFTDESDTNVNSFWFEKELNVYIQLNEEVPLSTRNAVVDSIFSTEQTPIGGFIGWQGALDRLTQAYPDNNVPNKFQLVTNELLADITVKLDSLPDVNKNRGGVALTTSTPTLMIPHTIGVSIIVFDADDKNKLIVASIMRHELGHALGLGHTERFNDLMSPAIIFDMKTISSHNIESLYQLYK